MTTLGLIGMGGLVTSHGAGMAVPDWPTSYGYNMFALPFQFWKGGVFYEHTHRLWASEVGLLTVILNFWLFGRKARWAVRGFGLLLVAAGVATFARSHSLQSILYFGGHGLALLGASFFWPRIEAAPKRLRLLGGIAFITVAIQGTLGGLRVVWFKDEIGIVHAALAQLFFILLCAIAMLTSRRWLDWVPAIRAPNSPLNSLDAGNKSSLARSRFSQLCLLTTILIFLQLVLGAIMRHQHAGLAIPDFPLAYGRIWPDTSSAAVAGYNAQRIEVVAANPITAFQIWLQMAHRAMAALIVVFVAIIAWQARGGLKRPAMVWLGLILIQAALGAWTVWSNKAADVATAHVLFGALSLALGALLTIILFRISGAAGRSAI